MCKVVEPRILTYIQAKHATLPWDMILSAELLGSYKPSVNVSRELLFISLTVYALLRNPLVYQGAMRLLSVKPEQCAMVAAHINDLRAAAQQGMRTIYVRRPTEDLEARDTVREKKDGGEVDIVVDGLEELATRLRELRG